jgi:tRNA-dihydrouridine synthase
MDREDVPVQIVHQTIVQHLDQMVRFYGERGVITFRKYLKAYLQPYAIPYEVQQILLRSKDPDEVKTIVAEQLT